MSKENFMCTAFTFVKGNFYFGRNMDIEQGFGEKVVITPRNFLLPMKLQPTFNVRYAMIGMANVTDGYPLYAEAVNEKGLCMAGLYFPQNAHYSQTVKNSANAVAPYELIPYVLGQCDSVAQAESLLSETEIADVAFTENLPVAPLHWIVSDRNRSIVAEFTDEGRKIYANGYGVLTNNPPFPFHTENIRQYLNLSAENTTGGFGDRLSASYFGEGMGAIGLPGDFSSASRFVRTVFLKYMSDCDTDTLSCVSQVMHILDSVAMVRGSVVTFRRLYDITRYSCCIDATNADYYYKTYSDNSITKVSLTDNRKNQSSLEILPLFTDQKIVVR